MCDGMRMIECDIFEENIVMNMKIIEKDYRHTPDIVYQYLMCRMWTAIHNLPIQNFYNSNNTAEEIQKNER